MINNAALMFVFRPKSRDIADNLNNTHADVCEHGRRPCILRCGVHFVGRTRDSGRYVEEWEPIPLGQRLDWLLNLMKGD